MMNIKRTITTCTTLEIGDVVEYSLNGETFIGMIIDWFNIGGYAQFAVPTNFENDEWLVSLPFNDFAFNFRTNLDNLIIHRYTIDGNHWEPFEYTFSYRLEREDDLIPPMPETLPEYIDAGVAA